MQVREKTGQTLTEPITVALMRTYLGLVDTTQDTLIGTMITASRKWLENHTGASVISKIYEVEFDSDDGYDNWFELPFAPVTSVTTVVVGSTAVENHERGQSVVSIYPLGTISTGTTNNTLDIEFVAGAGTELATLALYRIVADYYDARKDNPALEVSSASLKWDTMKLVNQLSNNTSI